MKNATQADLLAAVSRVVPCGSDSPVRLDIRYVPPGQEPSSNTTSGEHPRFGGEMCWLHASVAIAVVLLGVGLVAPIITLHKFVVVSNTFSVLTGIWQLLQEGKLFLFVVISLFSVIMPLFKLGLLFHLTRPAASTSHHSRRYLRWMHDLGRWSMLDVFVVAVLVVAVKLGMIASIETHYGLYAFAAAVLLTMIITARVVTHYDRMGSDPDLPC